MTKKKILFADDEHHLRALLKEILENAGYTCIEAADGKEALAQTRKHSPDLVILDVNMPKMDGFSVLEQLKKDSKTRGIPVIMLTTRSGQDDIETGIGLDANTYLPKPFEPQKLLQVIQQTFDAKGN